MIIFLTLSAALAGVNYLAVTASLYWYYWWFDILMHFWGGIMLGMGVHAFSGIKWLHIRPTLGTVLMVILIAVTTWETFEWLNNLSGTSSYLIDTLQDTLLGFSGGLLAHFVLQVYIMK